MTLNDDINRLSSVRLFAGFPQEQLRLLAFGSKRVFLRSGEQLFAEGQMSDGGYLIVSGQIDVVVDRNGREHVLSSQLENSLIGEMALITPNRRVASAVARLNSELLHIPRELFKRMLSEYPQLASLMHEQITRSVQIMLKQMSDVHKKLETIPNLSRPDIDLDMPELEEELENALIPDRNGQ
jgi:CRP-like cAMP-binding protein